MKKSILTVVSCIACAGLASVATADYEVWLENNFGQPFTRYGPFPSGSDQTIDLGTLPVGNQYLHIYDPDPVNGQPDDSAGMITIQGSTLFQGTPTGTTLSVFIAAANVTQDDAFGNRDQPLTPGLRQVAPTAR